MSIEHLLPTRVGNWQLREKKPLNLSQTVASPRVVGLKGESVRGNSPCVRYAITISRFFSAHFLFSFSVLETLLTLVYNLHICLAIAVCRIVQIIFIVCLRFCLYHSPPTPIFAPSWVVSPVYARFSLNVVRFCYATTRRLVCKQCPVWSSGGHGMMIYHMIWYVEINMLYEITMGNCNVVSLRIELPYVLYHAGGSTSCSLMKVHFN